MPRTDSQARRSEKLHSLFRSAGSCREVTRPIALEGSLRARAAEPTLAGPSRLLRPHTNSTGLPHLPVRAHCHSRSLPPCSDAGYPTLLPKPGVTEPLYSLAQPDPCAPQCRRLRPPVGGLESQFLGVHFRVPSRRLEV